MKLRKHEYSYNGQRLERDQFAYVLGPGGWTDPTAIVFWCPNGAKRTCLIAITSGEAKEPRWHWDGNLDAPTLTPSIGCDHRCGWHGHITKGEASAS